MSFKEHSYEEVWTDEYHKEVRYGLRGKILVNEKTDYQKITLVESKRYGKSLLLDGCWMTAEKSEKSYHECLVHPALSSAKQIKKVLIIGGGDGGTARECLRYKEVKHIDMIEIDRRVIELCQEYLPMIGGNAWEDPRLHVQIGDGIKWVEKAEKDSYDVVLIDGSDPIGPAKGLFNRIFFKNCKRVLKTGGVFGSQSESPESFKKIHLELLHTIKCEFEFADPLYGWVPLYPSGWWSWTFAAKDKPRYKQPIQSRCNAISKQCEIWSARWQKGAFEAIPAFIEREFNQ